MCLGAFLPIYGMPSEASLPHTTRHRPAEPGRHRTVARGEPHQRGRPCQWRQIHPSSASSDLEVVAFTCRHPNSEGVG